MVYIFNKTGELIEKLDNDGDCVTWLRENKHAKGRECEILMRINRSILHKIYYYDLIFSNVININLKDFDSIKDRISKLNIGDIIGGDEYEIIKLGRYKDGASKFIMKCLKCGAEKSTDYKGVVYSTKCNKCSLNEFEISDDKEYWIGFTQNKECFLFSGDDNIIKYIKSHTWRKTTQGYFQNRKGEKIHRVVMGVTDRDIIVNHLGGDKADCRKDKLSISNSLDNSKEKRISSRNNSGIIGLMKRGKGGKYVGNIKINDLSIYSTYKTRSEALLDLLIMQKHYGFRHNQDMFHLIDNISIDRYNEVISNCERQLNRKTKHTIKSDNSIELSECGNFYWCYDDDLEKEDNRFKISIEHKEYLDKGKWHVAEDKNHTKKYIHGSIIINDKRKTVKLHRYLMGLLDVKYKNWFIDHVDGDGLNNTIENLIITDAKGNGHKIKGCGYYERSDSKGIYRASGVLNGKKYDKTFYTEQEAIDYVSEKRKEFFETRLQFKTKLELDEYLNETYGKNII